MAQQGGFVIENCIIKGDKRQYDGKANNIGELIFSTLSETPEHVAQIDALTGKKKTFEEVKEKSIRLAAWLRNESVGVGDVVSVCFPRNLDAEIIFCAISFAGAIYTPLSHIMDLTTARHCINIARPRVIFAHESTIDTLQEAATLENHEWKIVMIGSDSKSNHESLDDILKKPSSEEIENFQVTKVEPKNTCAIFHTSGTTGLPKFVPLSHRHFIRRVFYPDVDTESRNLNAILLVYFNPGWIAHVRMSARSILTRQTLVFHKDFEPHETCKIIEKYKINALVWKAYMFSLLANSDVINKYDLQSVTHMHSVGAKLFDKVRGKALKIFPNVRFIGRGLGSIETGRLTLFTPKCRNPQSEGTALPNVQLKIVDTKNGLPLEHNKRGELCTKSPYMMTDYFRNASATKLAFDDEGWYRTGDEAYYDENGEIIVVGRLKDVIKYRETLLQPYCIEQSLLAHPEIVDAAVVGFFHDVEIEQPVVFVQTAQGSNVVEEDILKLTDDIKYGCIFKDWVVFTDKIPRNSNGKINRRILTEHAENLYKSHSIGKNVRE